MSQQAHPNILVIMTDHKHGFEKRTLGNFIAKPPGTPEVGGPRWTKFPGATSGQSRISVDTVGTGATTYQWFDRQVAEAAIRYLTARRPTLHPAPLRRIEQRPSRSSTMRKVELLSFRA